MDLTEVANGIADLRPLPFLLVSTRIVRHSSLHDQHSLQGGVESA